MAEEGERRHSQREALTLKVEYDDAAELIADYTENISQGGTFIQTHRELAEGTGVRLVLSFPGLLTPLHLAGVDFVIVDVYLPVMDGAQLIAHMRASDKLKSTPVVAVSAGGAAARDAAIGAGADIFLDKPMRLADIVDTIRRLARA
jgi:uncharacterized protein (TIGR02266 family)